jgi:recombination protein RecR
MRYPAAFDRCVACFTRFQGIGRKTAERLVFDILTRWDTEAVQEFAQALLHLPKAIVVCPDCRVHIESSQCPFCTEERRKTGSLCIVASSKDVYAIDATGQFPGTFFVLGTLLSPFDNRGVERMELDRLKQRIAKEGIKEAIMALDSSLEGDATVGFMKDELKDLPIELSRLAAGVPVGAMLEFVDRGTLSRAFSGRQSLR